MRDKFLNYHWVKDFYEKVVEKIGQETVDSYLKEIEEANEESYQRKKALAEANGWKEIARGVYTINREIIPKTSTQSNVQKELEIELEEFKKRKDEQRKGGAL